MTPFAAAAILAATLVTAFISGIFGMAGGLILMGVLAALVPVSTAMVTHGAIQMVSNGWRGWLLRGDIDWGIFGRYAAGAVIGVGALALVSWQPDKRMLYLLLGLTPMLVWLPRKRLDLDIQRPAHAVFAGAAVSALNTLAGVAGPLLDLFFVRTAMTRQQIVATKAVTQVMAHVVKIVFWGAPVVLAAEASVLPPLWLLALAVPLSMVGTWLGGRVLERMTDVNFKRWMKGLVTVIGAIYLARAAGLY